MCQPGCKVFVGDLKIDTQEREVEEVFAKYGQLRACFVARNPGGFGFVEFEEARDAEEAVKALNGTIINGSPIRTEISHGKKNLKKKMTWRPEGDYGGHHRSNSRYSPDRRRPRGYSPPQHRGSGGGSSSADFEIRRLREENERLRMELEQLRAYVGKY